MFPLASVYMEMLIIMEGNTSVSTVTIRQPIEVLSLYISSHFMRVGTILVTRHQATNKGDFTRHIYVFSSFSQCEYQAIKKISLTTHKLSVHGGKKYKCSSQFTQHANLTSHRQSVHVGIKYNCSQCISKFSRKGNFTKHTQLMHEGKRHKCSQCDYQATVKGHLTRH
jgi:DNA-directed RNA polymerase subunit RPC12/RpoP